MAVYPLERTRPVPVDETFMGSTSRGQERMERARNYTFFGDTFYATNMFVMGAGLAIFPALCTYHFDKDPGLNVFGILITGLPALGFLATSLHDLVHFAGKSLGNFVLAEVETPQVSEE